MLQKLLLTTLISKAGENVVSFFESDVGEGSDAFDSVQEQEGTVTLAEFPASSGNDVLVCQANAKTLETVTKAAVIKQIGKSGAPRKITMYSRFYFPAGGVLDGITLMDLECATCGIDTNPGIRLNMNSGTLRVERSKIGIAETMLPTSATTLSFDTWHEITWEVWLGVDNSGRTKVTIDGEVTLYSIGTTVLSQAIIDELAPGTEIDEMVDRWQVGVTANTNNAIAACYIDDMSLLIERA